MALRAQDDWKNFFSNAGIPDEHSQTYAQSFVDNELNEHYLASLDKDIELNVNILGHRSSILNLSKHRSLPLLCAPPMLPMFPKASISAKLPVISSEMTKPQFRKFKTDRDVYKTITSLPLIQVTSHLYNACDDSVQNAIINMCTDFLTSNEIEALDIIEMIVTQTTNPAVHRMTFGSIIQGEHETLQSCGSLTLLSNRMRI